MRWKLFLTSPWNIAVVLLVILAMKNSDALVSSLHCVLAGFALYSGWRESGVTAALIENQRERPETEPAEHS